MRTESVEVDDAVDRASGGALSPCQLNWCDQRVGSRQPIDAGRNSSLQICGKFRGVLNEISGIASARFGSVTRRAADEVAGGVTSRTRPTSSPGVRRSRTQRPADCCDGPLCSTLIVRGSDASSENNLLGVRLLSAVEPILRTLTTDRTRRADVLRIANMRRITQSAQKSMRFGVASGTDFCNTPVAPDLNWQRQSQARVVNSGEFGADSVGSIT